MRAHEFLIDDFSQPLGSVPNVACACATKRGPKRKQQPSLAARQSAVKPRQPVKPKSPVQPVASRHNSLQKSALGKHKRPVGPNAKRA
jgi:hypothetical protein